MNKRQTKEFSSIYYKLCKIHLDYILSNDTKQILNELREFYYLYYPKNILYKKFIPAYYEYIPLNAHQLDLIIGYINSTLKNINKNSSFIDIGAGTPYIQNAMTLFTKLQKKNCYGLEYNDNYCKLTPEFIHGDLLTYDFSKFDLLYSYNPIIDCNLMIKGLKNIMNTMNKNAIFIFVAANGNVFNWLNNQSELSSTHKIKHIKNCGCYIITKK